MKKKAFLDVINLWSYLMKQGDSVLPYGNIWDLQSFIMVQTFG